MVELAREENLLQVAREFVSPRFGDRRGMAFEPEFSAAYFAALVPDWRPVQVSASWALG